MKAVGLTITAIASYAAFRLVDLLVDLLRVAAFVGIAAAAWYLIDPDSARSHLCALWSAIR